jgi:hypothetical protein
VKQDKEMGPYRQRPCKKTKEDKRPVRRQRDRKPGTQNKDSVKIVGEKQRKDAEVRRATSLWGKSLSQPFA